MGLMNSATKKQATKLQKIVDLGVEALRFCWGVSLRAWMWGAGLSLLQRGASCPKCPE